MLRNNKISESSKRTRPRSSEFKHLFFKYEGEMANNSVKLKSIKSNKKQTDLALNLILKWAKLCKQKLLEKGIKDKCSESSGKYLDNSGENSEHDVEVNDLKKRAKLGLEKREKRVYRDYLNEWRRKERNLEICGCCGISRPKSSEKVLCILAARPRHSLRSSRFGNAPQKPSSLLFSKLQLQRTQLQSRRLCQITSQKFPCFFLSLGLRPKPTSKKPITYFYTLNTFINIILNLRSVLILRKEAFTNFSGFKIYKFMPHRFSLLFSFCLFSFLYSSSLSVLLFSQVPELKWRRFCLLSLPFRFVPFPVPSPSEDLLFKPNPPCISKITGQYSNPLPRLHNFFSFIFFFRV